MPQLQKTGAAVLFDVARRAWLSRQVWNWKELVSIRMLRGRQGRGL